MTQDEKRILYCSGQYEFDPPPVCPNSWDGDDWIKWIDACDGWRPVKYPDGWGYGNEVYHEKRGQAGVVVSCEERLLHVQFYHKDTGNLLEKIEKCNPGELINNSTK